jgi:hypothetical protein
MISFGLRFSQTISSSLQKITEFRIVRVSTADRKENTTLKTIHSFNFTHRRCLWWSIFYWDSTLPELCGNSLKSIIQVYLANWYFILLLRSGLCTLSCIRTITEFIIVAFTVEYPKIKTTLRITIDIARYILVYETSPQHSNLIF